MSREAPGIQRVVVLRPAGERSAFAAAAYRTLDLALAVPPLVALAPVFGLIAAAIRLESPGAALAEERRLGLDLEPYSMIVFRTRYDGHLTRVGAFLEAHRLHQLPVLLNVVRGEMSIVGPPPVPPADVADYPPPWFERFAVRPGLMCLASRASDAQACDSYLEYVRRRSLRLNVRICARHLFEVTRRES